VKRERPLEVGPGGQRFRSLVPFGHDAVALDRRAAPTREVEALLDDKIGGRESSFRVAVAERPIRNDFPLVRVEHRVERLVVDLDEFERVLGEIAIAGDDDRDRLAGVPHRLVGGRVVGSRAVDADREGARHRGDFGARQHADDARERERRSRVQARDSRMGEWRAKNGGVPGVRDRVEVVHEPARASEERLVFQAR
jgi:hypothetical protein